MDYHEWCGLCGGVVRGDEDAPLALVVVCCGCYNRMLEGACREARARRLWREAGGEGLVPWDWDTEE